MVQYSAAILGLGVLTLVLVDAFNTIVLARRTRHMFRIARWLYALTWVPFAAASRRIRSPRAREACLGVYGPLSLLLLFALWAGGLVVAFALLQWAVDRQTAHSWLSLGDSLFNSAAILSTLTAGDPKSGIAKVLTVSEGGLGLGFLGLVVGYLPVLYQSFSQRELRISLLDARGGSPPSASALLQSSPASPEALERQLEVWEEWEAQLLETQISFPMLAYFRSQHANQSWLTALVAMMDYAAILSICAVPKSLRRQATLTFAMGRHALSDIVVIFSLEERASSGQSTRSGPEGAKLSRLLASQIPFCDSSLFSEARLAKLRQIYEPQACALSAYFLMSIPAWISDGASRENWKVDLAERDEVPFAVSDPFVQPAADSEEEISS
jgi:hypothetical protein